MRFFRASPSHAIFAVSLLLIAPALGAAQKPTFPNSPKSDALNNIAKMRIGQLLVTDKPEYADAYKDLASYYADRIVHPPFNGKEIKGKENIDTLLGDFERYCVIPPAGRDKVDELNNQLANARAFAETMDVRLQLVMNSTQERLEKVNAARMLAMVARLPTDQLVNSFLKMIRDPNYPQEVKLYAFQGLGHVLAAVDPKDPTKGVIQDPDKLVEVCKELDKVITTVYPMPKVNPEHPAYAEPARVIQFIRREAIRALAQVKVSVVRNKAREPAARPLWTLLRVMRQDTSIAPYFSQSEQIEATIGVCQMRPDDLVNLDYVAYLACDNLIAYGIYHHEQKLQFQQNPRNKPAIAWKLYGYRLGSAMKQMKANAEKLPKSRADPVLSLIEPATTRFLTKMEQDGINAVPDVQPLANWKNANKPKVAQVFSDDPASSFLVQ